MAMKKISPVWQRYGADIRKRRKAAGMTQARLSDKVSLSSSAISYIESGALRPQADHAHGLDAALGAQGALVRMWETYTNQEVFPVGFRQFIDFERVAVELHEYQNSVVPGIVQTADYACSLITHSRPWDDAASIERLVDGRMKRQAILEREDRPIVSLVVDEHVIRRLVGDANIVKAQLGRIVEMVEKRSIRFQVVPRQLGAHPGFAGSFRVYVFKDRPTVASTEHVFDELIIDDADRVRERVSIFGSLQAEALSPRDSAVLIRQVRGEFDE